MGWTGDPIKDFERHDREEQRWLETKPKCCLCDQHIQQEDVVCIDGDYYCDDCLKNHRVDISG